MLNKKQYKKMINSLDLFGFKNYKSFLTSRLWKVFRQTVVTSKKFNSERCHCCNKKLKGRMHLHHIDYGQLLDPNNVKAVCEGCHVEIHEDVISNLKRRTHRVKRKNYKEYTTKDRKDFFGSYADKLDSAIK